MYGKPCQHSGGGGNGTATACALLGIADFIPGVLEFPPAYVASAYCPGWGLSVSLCKWLVGHVCVLL
jgi:hypothetical protein